MRLTVDEVRKIASLSRLDLTPAEEELFVGQLGAVVEYFGQLATVPAAEPSLDGSSSAEADDTVGPCVERDVFLTNAPQSFDGFLVVPQVKTASPDGES